MFQKILVCFTLFFFCFGCAKKSNILIKKENFSDAEIYQQNFELITDLYLTMEKQVLQQVTELDEYEPDLILGWNKIKKEINQVIKKARSTIKRGKVLVSVSSLIDHRELSIQTSILANIIVQDIFKTVAFIYYQINGIWPRRYITYLSEDLIKIIASKPLPDFFFGSITPSMIMDQRPTKTCVGYTGALYERVVEKNFGLDFGTKNDDVLAKGLYHASRSLDKHYPKEGANPSYLFEILKMKGVASRCVDLKKLDGDLFLNLKASLLLNQVIFTSFGRTVDWDQNGYLWPNIDNEEGHMMLVSGYDPYSITFANSAGKKWGYYGFGKAHPSNLPLLDSLIVCTPKI